jgi:DNA-binding IclR family transcriptional regulator
VIEDDLDGAVDLVPGGARGDGRSVLGAVAVLEFVASRASSAAPGVVEIARAVGREKSVVSRNLRTLVGAGLLVRDTVGAGYRIGPRIYRIAAGVREARIEELGERAVAALADRFGERSELYVRAGNLAMTVATASPDAPLQVGPDLLADRIGGRASPAVRPAGRRGATARRERRCGARRAQRTALGRGGARAADRRPEPWRERRRRRGGP